MRNKATQKNTSSPEKEKTINIILAVVIALILWAYVIGEVNPTTTQVIDNVSVELLNVQSLTSRELAVSGDSDFTVDVVIQGTRADIAAMDRDEIVAEADLFGWSEGQNRVPVTVTVPEDVELVEVRSDKIDVKIERLVAVSKVVEISYTGVLPETQEVGAVEIKPEQIEVTGAKSDVSRVQKIRVTVPMEKLSAEGATVQAEVLPVDREGFAVESVNLSADYVDVFAKIYTLKEVALEVSFVGDPGNGYGAETKVPNTIWIKGTKEAIKNIQKVSTQDVDLGGMTTDGNVGLTVLLPDDVELASSNKQLSAGISIIEVSSKTFTFMADQILIEGLTKGKSVDMDNATITVMLSAKKGTLGSISADNIKLYIDVTDLPVGEQTAKIHVESTATLQSVKVTPEQIKIKVSNADTE
ncbi:MAG: CdaR family protein [Eubacteriales bacterium]|nr:CdaR family protein [Eubacteriales bacterium]MDD3349987.1 CdaR family protein [Eubacteriales bacterium]